MSEGSIHQRVAGRFQRVEEREESRAARDRSVCERREKVSAERRFQRVASANKEIRFLFMKERTGPRGTVQQINRSTDQIRMELMEEGNREQRGIENARGEQVSAR